MALPPVFIEFLGTYTGLKVAADGVKRELAEIDAEGSSSLEGFGKAGTSVLMGIGAAAIGVAYESTKMAISFQQNMTRISTQAGVPKAALAGLSNDVLNLAGQVGFSPDSLSDALYHVESSFASIGITAPQAMNLVKVAAEGAAVGGANLVDVQNALDAAVASGIPGVQNLSQAMGALNAIVGSGDMQMQDLADALGTGVLAVVKGYGLSLSDVGAALATFGDNNIRGAVAATDLRMAVQALSVPAKAASVDLKKMGMTSTTLADDMKKGGLNLALTDLITHMQKAGLAGQNMGETITTMFGKKAGSGLAVLLGQYQRLESKYPELAKSANGFSDAVAQQNGTIQQKLKDLGASLEAIGIRIGNAILPYVTKFLGEVSKAMNWLEQHTSVFKALAAGLGLLTIAITAAKIATIEWDAALLANPVGLVIAGIVALGAGVYYAWTHFKSFRDAVKDVGHALSEAWTWFDNTVVKSRWLATGMSAVGKAIMVAWHAAWNFVAGIVRWFVANPLNFIMNNVKLFEKFWANHGKDIEQIAKAAWGVISAIVKFYLSFILNYLKFSLAIVEAIWRVVWGVVRDFVKMVWHTISDIISIAIKLILDIVSAFLDLLHGRWSKLWNDTMKIFGDLFTGIGHLINQFAQDALKLLWDAGVNVIKGLVNGIKSGFGMIKNVMKDAGGMVKSAFHSFMGIFSPSREMYKSGTFVTAGLVNSLIDGQGAIKRAAQKMGASILSGLNLAPNIKLGDLGTMNVPSLGTAGTTAGGIVQNVVQLEVQGHVLTDQDLRNLIQQELLRLDGRNGGSYLTAKI